MGNSSGLCRVVLYTTSAMQQPRSSLTLLRRPRRTIGRASTHWVEGGHGTKSGLLPVFLMYVRGHSAQGMLQMTPFLLDTGTGSLGWTNSCFRVLKERNDTWMTSGLRIHLIDSDRDVGHWTGDQNVWSIEKIQLSAQLAWYQIFYHVDTNPYRNIQNIDFYKL